MSARIDAFWSGHVSTLVGEFLLAGVIFTIGSRFWLERDLSLQGVAQLAGFTAAGVVFVRTLGAVLARPRFVLPLQILAGGLVSALLYAVFRGQIDGGVGRGTFAEFAAVFVVVRTLACLAGGGRRSTAWRDGPGLLRATMVSVGALWLHQLLITNGSIGAGDAYWYTVMTADFVTQWRAGVFPVFVGQSEFAFNGAVNPLRFAPGLQHLAGIVDLVTFRSLPFHGILNFSLLASFLGGALSCYACLRAIRPRAAWLAVGLSLLFSSCPGILALAYVGDLFMSVTTLPYVPLLLYGVWRTLERADRTGMIVMVAAAAALWFFHPPIALWGTAIAAVAQLFRLWRDGRKRETWLQWLGGAALFGALTCYPFVSVKTLGIPGYPASREGILVNLKESFAASLKPLGTVAADLGDYQLGWALWGTLAVATVGWMFIRPKLPAVALLAAAAMLLVFLVPIPGLLDWLWRNVPTAVVDITFMWPMQRLYVLLAGVTVFAAFLTLGFFAEKHWLPCVLLAGLCAGATWWPRLEAEKLQARALRTFSVPAVARLSILPQNRVLTRYSYNPFRSTPSYFSNGFVDPTVINRLLAADAWKELTSNEVVLFSREASGPGVTRGEMVCTQPDPASPTIVVTPTLTLLPGRRYALMLDFAHPDFAGAFTLRGSTMTRVYYRPDSRSGPASPPPLRPIGAPPVRPGDMIVWTNQPGPESITMQFFFGGPGPEQKILTFGSYVLRDITDLELPIKIGDWAPYRAEVTSPSASRLETPRLFLDGYRATVNGREVPVQKSPDSLVMFEVPAGTSAVELSYPGPLALRAAYYFSLSAWIALFVFGLRRSRPNPGVVHAQRYS